MTIQQNYIYNKMNKDGTNSSVNVLSFDTSYEGLLTQTGQISWNGDEGTFNMKLLEGSILQVGQETMFYGIASENIPNGSVVMINGVLGNRIKFALATYDSVKANPKVILGISTSEMVTNGYGYVAQLGNINDIYTKAGWSVGDLLYYDIEYSYLKRFNEAHRSRYNTLLAKSQYVTKITSSTISGTTATIYFATTQPSAPFAAGNKLTVRGVIASGATPNTCYQVDQATVTACTTTYVSYTLPSAPTGTFTITTNGVVDKKTLSEYYEFTQLIKTFKDTVVKKTPSSTLWTGTGTIIDPYLLNLTAFDTYLITYATSIKNGLLTNIAPSNNFLKIPLATVILKSDDAPLGRLLARPDIAYSFQNISDLNISNLQDNDTIRYNALGGYWFNTPVEVDITTTYPDEVTYSSSAYFDGGNIKTHSSGTFNILPDVATTVNIAGAATSLNLGASTGTLTLKNPTIIGTSSTQSLFNTVATTINFAGAATTLNIGGSSSNTALNGIVTAATQSTGDNTTRLATTAFVNNEIANDAIVKSLLTTAGDIIYASAASTPARLAAGTSGYFLKSNGAGAAPSWAQVATANWYPTTFAWSDGTTAGPTGSLTGSGMSAVSFSAIPSASATVSGVVNTTTQTFAGNKTFSGTITFSNTITGSVSGNAATATTATNSDKVDGYNVWYGTQASYDAIGTKDSSTIYFIS